MPKIFSASTRVTRQIGDSEWETVSEVKICTENTTLKEIDDWAKTFFPNYGFSMVQIVVPNIDSFSTAEILVPNTEIGKEKSPD